ncbi:MAG: menaquinone biosynthesis protein [Phycisphaerales bacterium]
MNDPTAETAAGAARIGCVSYMNTLPLIEGLGKLADVRLTLTAPSGLAGLLAQHEVDVALVSIIDYQRAETPLALLPCGMIGCDGPTMTVRVFSRVEPERITTLHADADSHTSVALASLVLMGMGAQQPTIEPFDVDQFRAHKKDEIAEGEDVWPEAMLLIGDKVVTDSPPAVWYPHQVDLGEAWKRQTGLPFVYAAWMCEASRAGDEVVRSACDILDRQRRHNATRLDWIVNQRAPSRGWPVDAARHYLRSLLRYDVTEPYRAAIERFFDMSAQAGLIDTRRPTVWADA